MAKEKIKVNTRTFYLNEQHELARAEKAVRGGHAKLDNINWTQKGHKISRSLHSVRDAVKKSKDPLREQRYFLLARPLKDVPKLSDNKTKAPDGHYLEATTYNQEHSLVFKKLGMDLIQVNDDGTATVHSKPERMEQLTSTAENLGNAGVPIPQKWLANAEQPHLRLVLSWDSPVNAAVSHVWASRKVSAQLRVIPDTEALRSTRTGHSSYPLVDRLYDLKRLPDNVTPNGDMWLFEISYSIIADHYPAIDFSPMQRVAFAAELFDQGEKSLSPQSFIQALPIAATMQRLSVAAVPVRNLVAIKSRV